MQRLPRLADWGKSTLTRVFLEQWSIDRRATVGKFHPQQCEFLQHHRSMFALKAT
jgi:hypothetical protein